MNNHQIVRAYTKNATIGFLDIEGERLQTLERPWIDNENDESCIPEGTYLVKRDKSGRWQYYSITNVPNRTFIEIHPANYVDQLEGCLALGMTRMSDGFSVGSSEKAVELFRSLAGEEDFLLTFRSFNPNIDKW